MYNTEFTPTYMDIQDEDLSNEKYQSDLLTVFNVTEYTDGLHEHMSILFKELNYPMDDILKHVFAFSSQHFPSYSHYDLQSWTLVPVLAVCYQPVVPQWFVLPSSSALA